MDHQDWNIAVTRWFDLRRRAIAQLICGVAYYYVIRMSRKRKTSYSMSSVRKRMREEIMGRISSSETIDDLDNCISRNEVTLESFDAYVDDGNDNNSNFLAHEMQLQDPSPTASSGSKNKKSKVANNKETDIELNELKGAMHEIVEALREGAAALREGNAIMRKCHNYKLPPISGEEAWNLIKECGFDTNSLPKIFCSLMKDVDKLRIILQCPAEARKAVIMPMVFGSSDLPSY